METGDLETLLARVRACRLCEASLEQGPRPVLQLGKNAPLVIIGQAPGLKVHRSGIPWDDGSGQRLRAWLGMDAAEFYDPTKTAVLPMGFCYPGKGKSGDLPPRPECAPLWHPSLLPYLAPRRLTLLVGRYAQAAYLKEPGPNLTETVRHWRRYLPDCVPLPHPSPRNRFWLGKNPWFEAEVLPFLRRAVRALLEGKKPPPAP